MDRKTNLEEFFDWCDERKLERIPDDFGIRIKMPDGSTLVTDPDKESIYDFKRRIEKQLEA